MPENSDTYLTLLRPQAVFNLNQEKKSPLLCNDKMFLPVDEHPYVVMEQ